jgi:hypothetical protein
MVAPVNCWAISSQIPKIARFAIFQIIQEISLITYCLFYQMLPQNERIRMDF